MKKLSVLLFFLFATFIQGQWFQQHSDIYQYYNTFYFLDSVNGWVGGYSYPGSPFILRTTDGGETWNQSLINSNPQSNHFTNFTTGFSACYNGIYKTTDGGETWILNYQDDTHFTSVQFLNENSGWAAGSESSGNLNLMRTQNGGVSWNKTLIATGVTDPKLKMINQSTGFIISEGSGQIRKTNDGGDSWVVVYNDVSSGHSLFDISFSDDLHGFAGGAGVNFLSTTDGGNTWEQKYNPLTFCTNIHVVENHCWVSGFGVGYNAIVYSDDYGNSWTPIYFSTGSSIQDVFFSDLNHGWYCSTSGTGAPEYNGFIYKTETGWSSNITSPSTPQQIYPLDGSSIQEILINFEWENLEYSLYRFQLSNDSLFNNFYVIVNSSTGDTVFNGNNLRIENGISVGLPYNQTYYWRVCSENTQGESDWSETWSFNTSSPTDVNDLYNPNEFGLYQNFPNPFNPSTTINFTVGDTYYASPEHVLLRVYDVLGNEIAVLVNEEKPAGSYEVVFNGEGLVSGVYYYKLTAGNFSETKKMVLIK